LTPTCDEPGGIPPVDEVVGWLIEGHRDADIRGAIKEKWPELDAVTLQNAAVEHFRRAANCEPAVIVGFALEAYRDLYRRMMKIGDFAGATKAVKELVALTNHVQRIRTGNPGRSTDSPEQEG
jgi:hypothetical protein